MNENAFPTRVRYYDRQFLQAADLRADQAYHRRMRWRHNLALHSWGILAGLNVAAAGGAPGDGTAATGVTVAAGMAIDGYGRELVLAVNEQVQQTLDQDQGYDVWLVYAEDEPRPPDRGRECGDPAESDRYQEKPRVRVTKSIDRRSPAPSRPGDVPTGDLNNFSPDRPAPAADRPWPVFLGRLDFREDADGKRKWQVDPSERRYAGLVAERILSRAADPEATTADARQRTLIVNGADPLYPDCRFAVAALDPSAPEDRMPFVAVREVQVAKPDGKDTTTRHVIELRSDRVTVAGDLVLRDGAALEFRPNPIGREADHAQALTGSEHWRMYHHFEPPAESKAGAAPAPAPSFSDEFRITMPAAPAGGNRVVVGRFGEQGKFEPVLAVKDDKSVEVYGTLRVDGEIIGRKAQVPAGTQVAVGPPSDEQMRSQLRQFLSAGNAPEQFRKVMSVVVEDGNRKPLLAEFVPGREVLRPDDVKRMAALLWRDQAPAEAIGEAVAVVGTGSSATGAPRPVFDAFLKKLPGAIRRDTSTDASDPTAQALGDWIFHADGFPSTALPEGRAGGLALSMPTNPKNAALVAFATKLWDDPNKVKALIQALINTAPKPPAPVSVEPGAGTFLEGIGAAGKLTALAAAMFDHKWKIPADAATAAPHGKDAVGVALLDELPAFGTQPTVGPGQGRVPDTARLREFFKHVHTEAKVGAANPDEKAQNFRRLLAAIVELAANIAAL